MMKKPKGEMCSVYVYEKTSFTGTRRCWNKGRVKRDGKWYCGQHDPEKVSERARKRDEEYGAKWAETKQNNTDSYLCGVARAAGLDPEAILEAAIKEKEGG